MYGGLDILDTAETGKETLEIIQTAFGEYNKDVNFAWYSLMFPKMTKDTFKTFDEFCGKRCAKVENAKSKEDILKEARMIGKSWKKRAVKK